MSSIRPFRAYRPVPELASKVASVPYDVVNTDEARELARGNPYSFLHVARPEIDLDPKIDIHDESVYEKGAENLKSLLSGRAFMRDEAPSLYIYQQKMGDRKQAGIVCMCSIDEYKRNLIKQHEHTRKDKEDDRVKHVTRQNANAEPVFLTFRSVDKIDSILNEVRKEKPLYDIVSPDGIGHTVWRISSDKTIHELVRLFGEVPALYVADGHHRTAAAVRYGLAMRNKKGAGDIYEWFMAVVFPHDQLRIMDYNRLVKDLNGMSVPEFLKKVEEKFIIDPAADPHPPRNAVFGMFLEGKWRMLTARPGTYPKDDPIKGLDVSILQDNLLNPILGIADPRTDKRIDFVGGIRGTAELEKRVKEGWAVAFSMYPTSLEQLMAVADAGEVMPPKSTWFEPKLRSGLLVRVYDE